MMEWGQWDMGQGERTLKVYSSIWKSAVTLGNLLNPSEPHLLYLQRVQNFSYLARLLRGIKDNICKVLSTLLTHCRHPDAIILTIKKQWADGQWCSYWSPKWSHFNSDTHQSAWYLSHYKFLPLGSWIPSRGNWGVMHPHQDHAWGLG